MYGAPGVRSLKYKPTQKWFQTDVSLRLTLYIGLIQIEKLCEKYFQSYFNLVVGMSVCQEDDDENTVTGDKNEASLQSKRSKAAVAKRIKTMENCKCLGYIIIWNFYVSFWCNSGVKWCKNLAHCAKSVIFGMEVPKTKDNSLSRGPN